MTNLVEFNIFEQVRRKQCSSECVKGREVGGGRNTIPRLDSAAAEETVMLGRSADDGS